MKYLLTLILGLSFSFEIYSQNGLVLIAHNNYLVGAVQNGKWLKDTDVSTQGAKPSRFIGFDSFQNRKSPEIYGTLGELGCGGWFFYFGRYGKNSRKYFRRRQFKTNPGNQRKCEVESAAANPEKTRFNR